MPNADHAGQSQQNTTPQPVLVACAHGTDNVEGRARIDELREDVAQLLPGVDVLEAYVDVQQPALGQVLNGLNPEREAVVVPLLLSTGYHVRVDIDRAVRARPHTIAAPPLGPHPDLVRLLAHKLTQALSQHVEERPSEREQLGAPEPSSLRLGGQNHERPAVVLAAAGSSVEDAAVPVHDSAAALERSTGFHVRAGFGSAAQPSVPIAVQAAREDGASRVGISSYLLAPGFFHDQLQRAGADFVTEPLLPSPLVAQIVIQRYLEACQSLHSGGQM